MADVDDIQGYGRKFDNQLAKLRESDIGEDDRNAIERYISHRDAQGGVNTGTLVSHVNRLRLTAERSDNRLVDMTLDDVNVFLSRLKREYELAEGTRRNYRKALRVFYQWRDEDWADEITIGASPSRSVDPDDLLTDDEIRAMLDAAPTPRDSALIALLDDTGLRIGAIGSLRIGDIDMSDQVATVTINENANVKDASGTKPLTWSRGYVANWLEAHPRSDDSEAALIHKTQRYDGDDDGGAINLQNLSRRLKRIASNAGLDEDRLHSHLFRKTAISRWIREDMSEQVIKHRADWSEDSQQFETYSGVAEEELNEMVLEHYDLADPDDEEQSVKLDTCPVCHASLRGDELFCASCAAPVADAAVDVSENLDETSREFLVEEDDPDRREVAAEIVDAAKDDPVLASALADEFGALTGND